MAGNDAQGKPPTLEEQAAQFKGFSVQDGEVFDGNSRTAADERAATEASERTAAQVNSRSHKENAEAGTTGTQPAKGSEAAKVELTAEEEQDALQEATDKKGAVLTDEEADAIVEKAIAAKGKAAGKPQPDPDKAKKAFERREARRRENLQRENDDLRRQLAAKSDPALTNDTQGDKTPSKAAKPDHTDAKYQYGELDAKYIADLARYETLEAIRAEKESEKTQQKTQKLTEEQVAFKERVEAFEEAGTEVYDDFHEVVMGNLYTKDNPSGWPCSDALGELILESDHGTKIAYDLASDIKEARRIYQLSPARQAAWFGVAEAKLSAGSAKSTDKDQDEGTTPPAEARKTRQLPQPRNGQVRESKAPAPLSKLNGTGGNRVPNEATTDFAAFEAMANQVRKT
jgi:hypothetical protein